MKRKISLKHKSIMIIIVVVGLFAITSLSRTFITPVQADPLTGMTCTSIEPIQITLAAHGTGEKPQSKVWTHDGEWWAVFPTDTSEASSEGTLIWKLVENSGSYSWSEVLNISDLTDSKADVKVDGNVAHILLFANGEPSSTELVSVEYSAGTYQLWTMRPSTAFLSFMYANGDGSETATIDLDSTGRMWLATKNGSNHIVYYSDPPYAKDDNNNDDWFGPVPIGLLDSEQDDISVVTAMPGNKIGVLWSDQDVEVFKFRTHTDGADPATWSSVESPPGQTGPFADDHLNVAVATDGTVYAAVKTGDDTIELLVRDSGGSWASPYQVDEKMGENTTSRPIVQLNEAAGVLNVIYPTDTGAGNDIVYKQTAVSNISFGDINSRVTLQSGLLNDPSSMKENYNDELVVIFFDRESDPDLPRLLKGEFCQSAVTTPEADLGVTKVDAVDPITIGDNITYTVTVANGGPDTAENVVLIDTLPATVNYVSATLEQGSCGESSGIVTCDLNAINNGNTVNVTIVAMTTMTGTLTNNVSVSSDADDNNSENNSASEETTINPCIAPTAVSDVSTSTNGTDVTLNWTAVANADQYEVWWGFTDPYFDPGNDCSISSSCDIVTSPTEYTHLLGAGVVGNNHAYIVKAVNICGPDSARSDNSNRTGEFDFSIVKGTP